MSLGSEESLKGFVSYAKPALQASLDAVCVIDSQRRIVYCNLAMKSFFGLSARDLAKKPDFSRLIEFTACKGKPDRCCLGAVLERGEELALAETPALKGEEKLRISIRAVPILGVGLETEAPLGAVVSLRDSTGEILLQAKYHKLLELMERKEANLAEVTDRLENLRARLAKARR